MDIQDRPNDFSSVDPHAGLRPDEVAADYPQHEKTYAAFTHLLRWVCAHLLLLVVGLYFLIMQNNPAAGTLFVLAAIAAIVYGIATIGSSADKIARHPENWHGAARHITAEH